MDFSYSEEQLKLQEEIHDFFVRELPTDYQPSGGLGMRDSADVYNFRFELQKKAGQKGYLAPGWSKDSGGLGLSDMEQGIVVEETSYWGITWPSLSALKVCGPPLHVLGTEEQKKQFLPPIARGEVVVYQAFTEPERRFGRSQRLTEGNRGRGRLRTQRPEGIHRCAWPGGLPLLSGTDPGGGPQAPRHQPLPDRCPQPRYFISFLADTRYLYRRDLL